MQKLATAKNFIAQRKTKILTTALVFTTTVAVVSQLGLRQHDKFLKEHDLFDTFHAPRS